jgi:hypothetical protein
MTTRVVIGGIAAAAVIAGTTGAVAAAGPSGPAKPTTAGTASAAKPTATDGSSSAPKPKATASPDITVDPNLTRAAAQLGVSVDRLLQALPKAKLAAAAGGSLTDAAAARAVAGDLGVSPAQAQRALRDLFGAQAPGPGTKSATTLPPDQALSALASRLHVSTAKAREVLDALSRVANPGHGIDPASPAFAALAHSLGKTPAQLTQILREWKMALRSTLPQSPSPQPATPS